MLIGKQGKARRTCIRIFLIVAGTNFVVLGVVGIFVPLLPTTPFLLLAAACYARSSPRCHKWLLNNRWFGQYIRNYLENKGCTLKVKRLALTFLWTAIGFSILFAVQSFGIRLLLVLIAIGVSVHILRLQTLKQ